MCHTRVTQNTGRYPSLLTRLSQDREEHGRKSDVGCKKKHSCYPVFQIQQGKNACQRKERPNQLSRKQADEAPAIPVSGLMDNSLVRYNNTNRTYKHMTWPLQHASASEYQAASLDVASRSAKDSCVCS